MRIYPFWPQQRAMELGFLLRMTKLPFPRGMQHRSRREIWEVKDLEGASVAHNQEQRDPTADSQSLGGQIWISGSDSAVPPAGRPPSQAENRKKDQWVTQRVTD